MSHTTRDRRDLSLAHRLAASLEERGAKVWIAPESIPIGTEWQPHLVSAILAKSTHFLVILSRASIEAEWVIEEIRLARERYERDRSFRVLSLAGSTDRRNTFCELLSWGLKEQGLSWPFIEPPGDRAELGLAMQ